nr:protocadherin beta-18-like [Cherax quadricarinatus]
MAVNVLVPLLIPLGEQLTNVTKLVGSDPVEFERPEYVTEVPENTTRDLLLQLSARVQSSGVSPEFVIKEGDERGHFWLHPTTGRLALRTPLDFEAKQEVTFKCFDQVI